MTPYQTAFLELMTQRDMVYLQLEFCVVVAMLWYRLWFQRHFKIAISGGMAVVAMALAWGFYQLL